MIFKISEYLQICSEYVKRAPPYEYAIEFVISGVNDSDINSIKMWLRRRPYKGFSFMLCDSSTKHKDCRKEYVKKGSAGRPKLIVKGIKTERHLHGVVAVTTPSVECSAVDSELHEYFMKRRNKNKSLKQQKIKKCDELFIIKYMNDQADHIYRYGDFNFQYFLDDRYTLYK